MGVSGIQNVQHAISHQRCHCAVDDLLAPIRGKMKVLKKIKKRIGLSPRSCTGSVSNQPPMLFHQVHGDNVRITHDGAVARRVESFCRGVTFSNRPIKVQEKVHVKFLEVSNNWSGVVRFGFTSTDPTTLRYSLPKYACPDLTNKPGYWAKALAERFAERDTILFYYVTPAGDVHFGINGEEKGIFFSGVDTRGPLWALFDIYGNSTGIELISPRTQLNNCRRSPEIERVLPTLQALSLSPRGEDNAVTPRVHAAGHLVPLPFHKTRGHNIRMSNDRCVATRSDTEFCHGYVFTARPIRLEEKIIIQVLATESMYVGALAFGLTSCDPSQLSPNDLPEDADALLDRREYWVVNKDVAGTPQRGDELAFCVSTAGEVTLTINGGPHRTIMHVDHSLQLWAFFDAYGSTHKIRIAGALQSPRPEPSRVRPVVSPTTVSSSPCESNGINYRHCCIPHPQSTPSSANSTAPPTSQPELLQLQPSMAGGTVLVVNLPPTQASYINPSNSRISSPSQHGQHSHAQSHSAHSSSTLMSNYSNTYIEPVSAGGYSTMESMSPWMEANSVTVGSECSICYERAIDSVLYMCGHMCMCYDCALQQWRGKGGGHCPLCRAVIRDVIRTYKS